MAVAFVNVNISRLIVHEIFTREPGNSRPPSLSTECSVIDGDARDIFLSRLTKALGADSHCVEMQIVNDGGDSAFSLTVDLVGVKNDDDYVEISGTLATLLHRAQSSSASIPGGIVVVFAGTMGPNSLSFVCVIKAEVQEGFRKQIRGGRLTLELVKDLFLTPQQKLYKIGLFSAKKKISPSSVPNDFEVYVYDSNMVYNELGNAAKYFAENFLGCDRPQSAKRQTKDFFQFTREYIESEPSFDDSRRVDLKGALYTYLKVSTNETISVSDFGKQFLSKPEQGLYSKHMQQKEFPKSSITKDLSLVLGALRRVRIRFSSDVQINAPSDQFNDRVKVEGHKGGYTTVKIQGHIQRRP